MKKRVCWISCFCLAVICLQSGESAPAKTRNQDLKIVLQKTLFHPQTEPFLNMIATEAISSSQKAIDSGEVVQKFRESFEEEAIQAKFHEPYAVFSDEEIRELRKIYENPVFAKYAQYGGQAFQANVAVMQELFRGIVEKNGIEKKEEKVHSELLEITQSNFQKEIAESAKPLIVDVYSASCPPCRMMEPIIEEMSSEYKDSIRFVKINCDTEAELARQYGVTQLPTLLFIKPGKETPSMKTSGFTPKKDFQAKIAEFLKDQNSR